MLNLKDHKAGWPIPILYGVPSTDFVANTASPRRTKRKSPGKNEPSLYDDFPEMSSDIYAYIFSICELKEYQPNTKHHSVYLLQKYIEKKGMHFKDDVQLIALVCILISSKLMEIQPIKVEELHRLSNHCYTNKEIIMAEHQVLETFHYKIFFRKYLISDKLEVYSLLLSCLHPTERMDDLVMVSNLILDLLFENVKIFESFTSQRLLIASMLTQFNGRFPLIWRMSMIIKFSEDEITQGSMRILKHILSKDFFKSIKID